MRIIIPLFFLALFAVMLWSGSIAVTLLAGWLMFLALVVRHFMLQARSLNGPEDPQ